MDFWNALFHAEAMMASQRSGPTRVVAASVCFIPDLNNLGEVEG